MVNFYPREQPLILRDQEYAAERSIWRALENLTGHWSVFYSVRDPKKKSGAREADYVLLREGILFFVEVKGGRIEVDSPAQPGVTWRQWSRGSDDGAVNVVRPTQLWRSTGQILQALERDLGLSPKALGFRYCKIFIFPNTARATIPYRDDLDAPDQRFFFAEDMNDLAGRIEAIASEPYLFAAQPQIYWIIRLRETLEQYVPRPGFGDARSTMAPAGVNRILNQMHAPRMASAPISQVARVANQPPRQFDLIWKRTLFPWFCGIGAFLLILSLWPLLEPGKSVSSANVTPAGKPLSVTAGQSKPLPPANKLAPASASIPGQKAVPRPEEALPPFIPAGAVAEIERIFETARTLNISLRWSAGTQYGYVTLQADEGNGCRRWRLSRNDETPVFDFIRRCS